MTAMDTDEFRKLAEDIASNGEREGVSAAYIRKMMLHQAVLSGLDAEGVLDNVIFQGGSCLSEVYGNPRLSDDLDFAADKETVIHYAEILSSVLRRSVENIVDADVRVKSPNPKKLADAELPLARWTVSIDLSPENPSIPMERLKLEVAGVPVHDSEVRFLQPSDFQSVGQGDIPVLVESTEELLADKVVSLVMSSYPRYRDAWDIVWLTQNGADVDKALGLTISKLEDYGYNVDPEPFFLAASGIKEMIESDGFASLVDQLPGKIAMKTVLSARWRAATTQKLQDVLISTGEFIDGGITPGETPGQRSPSDCSAHSRPKR